MNKNRFLALVLVIVVASAGCDGVTPPPGYETVTQATEGVTLTVEASETPLLSSTPSATMTEGVVELTAWPTPTRDSLTPGIEATVLGGTPWWPTHPKFDDYGLAVDEVDGVYTAYFALNIRRCEVGYFYPPGNGRDPAGDCSRVGSLPVNGEAHAYTVLYLEGQGWNEWEEWLCIEPIGSYPCDRVVILKDMDGGRYGWIAVIDFTYW